MARAESCEWVEEEVEGRKKKWKRKAMNEDEGRSDQLGLALVLSERL